MAKQRTDRLNSLLKEVISEVIRRDLKHVDINELITITRVEITKDLRHAKVYFSVIGDDLDKAETLSLLEDSSKQITHIASRKVVMRYFPQLQFIIDEGVENQMRVEELLQEISKERTTRDVHNQPEE